MIIERIWAANELRNYNYVIACSETGDALVVDPLDAQACLAVAKARGWTITQIVNTHEHRDHTAGNAALVQATGAKVLAHAGAAARIGGVDATLSAWDVITVGRSIELECLDTPGHTLAHVCLLAHADGAALFSGDTLFNAGVGNCRQGGDPGRLFESCVALLELLPDSTRIYPGHDYLQNNLGFTHHVEQENQAAAQWLQRCATLQPESMPVLTLADELQFNVFFRLDEPGVIDGLRRLAPELGANPEPREVFLRLRALRNSW
jgi:hydroxyacylglutathione hydrolase